MKNLNKGITLVALIITIIVLLILAGISVIGLMGENGIIKYSSQAAEKYQEQKARETLELELLNLKGDKLTKSDYNQEEYLTNYLKEKGFFVNENIITVNGYSFQISRNELLILANLGKGIIEENPQIAIESTITNSSDYGSANIEIKISYEGNLTSIELNNNSIQIPEKLDGKYVIAKQVTKNGTYTIVAKDENGKYRIGNIDVTELTEDIIITTAEELKAFRDKVNMGGTYEGKTVTLGNDITLNKNRYRINEDKTITFDSVAEQWDAIGTIEKPFRGVFEGNNYNIKGIYINDETKNIQGFFGTNYGTIKNLTLEEGSIISGHWVGGICGANFGRIENTTNRMNIESKTRTESGNAIVGGIAGYSISRRNNNKQC